MWDPAWAKLTAPLISLFSKLSKHLTRLARERNVGDSLFELNESRSIDKELDKTLTRLRGEVRKDNWMSQFQASIEHAIVTPEFLDEQEVKDWLSEDQVCKDLKTLASARLLGAVEDDGTIKQRIIQAYLRITSKHKAFAVEATDTTVAILVAGYRASVEGPSAPLAGLMEAGFTENRETLQNVLQGLSNVGEQLERLGADDLVVVTAHTDLASRELNRILKIRGLHTDSARDDIRALVDRIMSSDLRFAKLTIKTRALYWAARLHTSDLQRIPTARTYLDQLRKLDPGYDTRIVDAYILEREGNIDRALQLLRDCDDPDAHSALWSILSRSRGNEAALTWFEQRPGHENADFLTGIGWSNLAVALAEMDKWNEACDCLAGAHVHLEEWPDLAFVEGVFNAAMLLPSEIRNLALQMQIFNSQIQVIKGPDTEQRRLRASVCFSQAERLMTDIGEIKRAEIAKVWLLWLRLTDGKEEIKGAAREEVREIMRTPAQAIDFLPVAIAFGIDFDKDPLRRYLIQRAQMGGLEGEEIVAELLLAETTMTARERADFLEREESRLATKIPIATLAGKRIEALLADGQIARSKHVLEVHKNDFAEYDYDRLRALILKREGGDPRTAFEEIYSRTGLLFDLQNLVQETGQAGDWTTLRPLLEKLFRLERTKHNAHWLVDCMQRDQKSGYASVVIFFQENPDVVDWSDGLKASKAWALFYLGQSKEARTINEQLLKTRNDPADLQLDMNLAIQSGDWERFPAIVDRERGLRKVRQYAKW